MARGQVKKIIKMQTRARISGGLIGLNYWAGLSQWIVGLDCLSGLLG